MISILQNTPNAVEQVLYEYDYLLERIKLHGAFRLPRAKIKVYLLLNELLKEKEKIKQKNI